MNRIDQVDAFVIMLAIAVSVHAMKDHILSLGPRSSTIDQLFQADAFPFAYDAPAFDAIVARDLGACRHGLKVGERKKGWFLHQTGYFQSPTDKLLWGIFDVLCGNGWRVAVGSKDGRNIFLAEFLGEFVPPGEQPMHPAIDMLRRFKNGIHGVVLAQTVK